MRSLTTDEIERIPCRWAPESPSEHADRGACLAATPCGSVPDDSTAQRGWRALGRFRAPAEPTVILVWHLVACCSTHRLRYRDTEKKNTANRFKVQPLALLTISTV